MEDLDSTVKILKNPEDKFKGNLKNRISLAILSIVFSGWGQWQGSHRIKASVFLFASIPALIATVILESPGFFYLAAVMGLFTGPLIISFPLIIAGMLPSFNSPLIWLGLPVKLICVLDSWMLGGKKEFTQINKKWALLFLMTALLSFGIFNLKFSIIRALAPSETQLIDPGDTIVVLNKSVFGLSKTLMKRTIKRGDLVSVKSENTHHFYRVIAVPGEKVKVTFDHTGIISFRIEGSRLIKSKIEKIVDPCVFFDSSNNYIRCNYFLETLGNKSYRVAYPSGGVKMAMWDQIKVELPENRYFLLPDVRSNETLSEIISTGLLLYSKKSITGFPISILWSSHAKEGIRWHRLGRNMPGKGK
ncbi:S26 family signal peptidase [Myxococcota bacterium]|nr:S26 family signal peptidase [Myxococcota bacterium]MBU1379382.1 S26 family signal peptidase [Myxococcota bacterium]MBU1496784.1 S26 family signal peptidase [Myxococcota bacterium]